MTDPYHALLAGAVRARRALRRDDPALAAELSALIDAAEVDLRARAVAGEGSAASGPEDAAKVELARCVLFALRHTHDARVPADGGGRQSMHGWFKRALVAAGYGPVEMGGDG